MAKKKAKKKTQKKVATKVLASRRKKVAKKPKKVLRKTKSAPKKVVVKKKKIAKKAIKKNRVPKPKRIISKKAISYSGLDIRPEAAFSAQNLFKAKIKVIGIGGGGGSIVSDIGKSLGKAMFVAADTDIRSFKPRKGIKQFLFGQSLTHGLGTGMNTDLALAAAESEKEKISKLFENQDIVILIAALGGGVGSGATKIFAEASKKYNCITFGIFTLPFKFEGKNKYAIALKSLRELRRELNVSITIPNERIFKVIDENTSITEAFSLVNKNLVTSLEALIDLIYNPGVINIDFADVRTILKGRGNLAFLNTAEVSGKNGADEIMTNLLNNPLYQNNNFVAEKILFNIAGSATLSMIEVDKISRAIASQNPKAKIIFGISKNPSFKNKIKTTLLMTGPGFASEVASELREVKEEARQEKKNAKKKKPAAAKAPSAPKKKETKVVQEQPERVPFSNMIPQFNSASVDASSPRLTVIEHTDRQKKAIRRSALEIKKAQEQEENEKSQQEKEWEIPAFLRMKK